MTETVICEKCGSIMLPVQEEHTCGYTCPICGNGWVTMCFSTMDTNEIWRNASNITEPKDFVADIAKSLHPDAMRVRVIEVRDSSPTSRTYRFVSEDGHIPPFQSGQYVNFRLQIGESTLTRPYSISSAPYEARPKTIGSDSKSSGSGDKTTVSGGKASATVGKASASDSNNSSATNEPFFEITVVRGIEEDVIETKGEWPVAVALERAGIPVDTHCRGGACGFCRSQLLSGDIFVSPLNDGRRMMDKEFGWFHPCAAWPLSDLRIKIPIL